MQWERYADNSNPVAAPSLLMTGTKSAFNAINITYTLGRFLKWTGRSKREETEKREGKKNKIR